MATTNSGGSGEVATDLLAALNNPLRRQVLRRMHMYKKPMSPRHLAAEFELPVSNMAYHVRVLANCGAITLVGEEPVRGAVKHFYNLSLKPSWARKIIAVEPDPDVVEVDG